MTIAVHIKISPLLVISSSETITLLMQTDTLYSTLLVQYLLLLGSYICCKSLPRIHIRNSPSRCFFQAFEVTVLLPLAVAPVDPDLMHCDEVFWTEPTLVLDLPTMDLVEVFQVVTPHKSLEVRTNPAFAVMESTH